VLAIPGSRSQSLAAGDVFTVLAAAPAALWEGSRCRGDVLQQVRVSPARRHHLG